MATVTRTQKPQLKVEVGGGSDEPFSFVTSLTDADGAPVVITVPSMAVAEINEFKMQLLRERSAVLAAGYAIRCTLGGGDDGQRVMEQLAELPPKEATRFSDEWTAHSGVSSGESAAS